MMDSSVSTIPMSIAAMYAMNLSIATIAREFFGVKSARIVVIPIS